MGSNRELWAVTKGVMKHPFRIIVQKTISELSGIIPYAAGNGRYYFSSFLNINQRKEEIQNKLPRAVMAMMDFRPLETAQADVISIADLFMRDIASRFASEVGKIIGPAYVRAVDPFLSPDFPKVEHNPDLLTSAELHTLCNDTKADVDKLVKYHISNPSLVAIAASLKKIGDLGLEIPSAADISESIFALKYKILEQICTEKHSVGDLELLLGTAPMMPERDKYVLRYLSDLLCIRMSLESICTLIFDAFIYDELIVVSKSNLFNIESRKRDRIAHQACIEAVSLQRSLRDYAGKIVFSDGRDLEDTADSVGLETGLALVTKYEHRFSQSAGASYNLSLCYLDAWLNPFRSIASG